MKTLSPAWAFVLTWGFFILLLVLFVQAKEYTGANPILRQRQRRIEAFQSGSGADKASPRPEEAGGLQPGAAALNTPREPYALLSGWLSGTSEEGKYSAQRCYETDFQARLERTGNYRQLTNNYKRAGPDSCTAPLQDVLIPFYQNQPV